MRLLPSTPTPLAGATAWLNAPPRSLSDWKPPPHAPQLRAVTASWFLASGNSPTKGAALCRALFTSVANTWLCAVSPDDATGAALALPLRILRCWPRECDGLKEIHLPPWCAKDEILTAVAAAHPNTVRVVSTQPRCPSAIEVATPTPVTRSASAPGRRPAGIIRRPNALRSTMGRTTDAVVCGWLGGPARRDHHPTHKQRPEQWRRGGRYAGGGAMLPSTPRAVVAPVGVAVPHGAVRPRDVTFTTYAFRRSSFQPSALRGRSYGGSTFRIVGRRKGTAVEATRSTTALSPRCSMRRPSCNIFEWTP
jgi:hypothetical protein